MLIRAASLIVFLLPTIGSAETALDELQRMEQKWRDASVVTYTFRPHGEYNLVGDTPPVVVQVHNRQVTTITFESPYRNYRAGQRISQRALERMRPAPILTVEEFFDFIRANIDPDEPAGSIQYHETLGYPLRVLFDDPNIDDEEMLVSILWLEIDK